VLLTIRSSTETHIKYSRFSLIVNVCLGNLSRMTRTLLSPLVGLGAMVWSVGAHSAVAAPGNATSTPFQVAAISLGGESALPAAPPEKPRLGVSGAFQPAPMPDPDIEAPSGGGSRGASLAPALFSHKEEFAGDGFAPASNADYGLDHRRAPAAGLNWSVPVK